MAKLAPSAANLAVARSVKRAAELLKILDREHTTDELRQHLKGVRHELANMAELMPVASVLDEYSEVARVALRTRPHSLRHRILGSLLDDPHGWTAFELADDLDVPLRSVRSRVSELQAACWVEGERRPFGASGRNARNYWLITEAGRKALQKLDSGQLALIEVTPSA